MSYVTFMYWYGSQEFGGEKLDIVVAECSRCGLRVSVRCERNEAEQRCNNLFRARCRLGETNTYWTLTPEKLAPA